MWRCQTLIPPVRFQTLIPPVRLCIPATQPPSKSKRLFCSMFCSTDERCIDQEVSKLQTEMLSVISHSSVKTKARRRFISKVDAFESSILVMPQYRLLLVHFLVQNNVFFLDSLPRRLNMPIRTRLYNAPEHHWADVHMDASFSSTGDAAVGLVVKPHGLMPLLVSHEIVASSSDEAEEMAFIKAVLFCHQLGIPCVRFISDNRKLVMKLEGQISLPLDRSFQTLLRLKNKFLKCEVVHTFREGNVAADALSRLSNSRSGLSIELKRTQEKIKESLLQNLVAHHFFIMKFDLPKGGEYIRPPGVKLFSKGLVKKSNQQQPMKKQPRKMGFSNSIAASQKVPSRRYHSTSHPCLLQLEALKRRLNATIEYARFLQDTMKEMAKGVQNSRSGEIKKTAEDLDEFLNKVGRGAVVSNDEVLGFAKLFNDELTLDSISRPQLVSMCKYMGMSLFGTDAYLHYMFCKRLRRIKKDDELIQAEGVVSLSEAELCEDCREQGMLGLLSVGEMSQQLRDWLDSSLNSSVPSSLLILSRSFTVSGKLKPEEAFLSTLSSLPDEVVDTVGVTALRYEDSVSERRRKLEYLEMQEEMIKEEEELARMKESNSSEEDVAFKEMTIPTAREAQEPARARELKKQEHLCDLSCALAVLASAYSVSSEREDFLGLINKEIELYQSMVEKEGTVGEKKAPKAYKAAREENKHVTEVDECDVVSPALFERVDAMLQNPEKEIDDADAKIGDCCWLLDSDYDGKVTPEEVAAAAMYLKDTLGKGSVQEEAVLSTLSSLPDEVGDTVGLTALPSEDSVSERRGNLEYLEMQEEMIKEEEGLARMNESKASEEDVALKEITIPTASEAQDLARAWTLDKQEHLCELSRALAVLASASPVCREREDFLGLANKEIVLYNSMVEKKGTDGEKEALEVYKSTREENEHASKVDECDEVSSALIEKEIDDVDAKIGDRWRLLDRDYDGKVTPEELAVAAMCMKDTLGKEGVQELISNLSKRRDGKILVEDFYGADGKILVEDMVKLGSQTEDGNATEEGELFT